MPFVLAPALFFALSNIAASEISFQEVTQEAGIDHVGYTFGASWGEFNGDGWPDLWVGNHSNKPTLYLNQGDGTFADIIDQVWHARPLADTHGAAWADYDNDGDQDLVELVGAGFGRGRGSNHLFVNEDGMLRDQATVLGVDQPFARGRSPLWFDVDRDGLLDLVLINKNRSDRRGDSAVFLQTSSGFQDATEQLEFEPGRRSVTAWLFREMERVLGWEPSNDRVTCRQNSGFATIGNLLSGAQPELLTCHTSLTIYDTRAGIPKDITDEIELPSANQVHDLAMQDFDGDGQTDLFLASARSHASEVHQPNDLELRAFFVDGNSDAYSELSFRTSGELDVQFHGPIQYDRIRMGRNVLSAPQGTQSGILSNETRRAHLVGVESHDLGRVTEAVDSQREISIHYDPAEGRWAIRALAPTSISLLSTAPISNVETQGVMSSDGAVADMLLVRDGSGFRARDLPSGATACYSVAAADFDNDMDVDVYLVCGSSTTNHPNILYENDGSGVFVAVEGSGGAAGSPLGRGDSATTADFDRDGFVDLFVTNGSGHGPTAHEGPHQLFRNLGNSNNWIEIDLEGARSNRDGIGAVVQVQTGNETQTRVQSGGMHRLSQDHQRLHFGLGKYDAVDEIVISWPSGTVQSVKGAEVNRIIRIVEPD